MATKSPAKLRKPSNAQLAYKSNTQFKLVKVSCLDLARLLDWCENSIMPQSDSSTMRIRDVIWYREAFDSASIDFSQFITDHGGAI